MTNERITTHFGGGLSILGGGSSDDMTDNATRLFLLHPSAQYFSGGHFAIVAWDAADIENRTVRECVSFILYAEP